MNKSIRDDSSLTTAEEDTYHTIGGDSVPEEEAAAEGGLKMKNLGCGKSADPKQQPETPNSAQSRSQSQTQKSPEVKKN